MTRRCGNTIHSNYVSDHRCVKEHEHEGDCWFGFGIPNLEYVQLGPARTIPEGFEQDALYRVVRWPYATPVSNQERDPASVSEPVKGEGGTRGLVTQEGKPVSDSQPPPVSGSETPAQNPARCPDCGHDAHTPRYCVMHECACGEPDSACEHEWVDATNEVVESGELCVKCHAIRAAQSPASSPEPPTVLPDPDIDLSTGEPPPKGRRTSSPASQPADSGGNAEGEQSPDRFPSGPEQSPASEPEPS